MIFINFSSACPGLPHCFVDFTVTAFTTSYFTSDSSNCFHITSTSVSILSYCCGHWLRLFSFQVTRFHQRLVSRYWILSETNQPASPVVRRQLQLLLVRIRHGFHLTLETVSVWLNSFSVRRYDVEKWWISHEKMSWFSKRFRWSFVSWETRTIILSFIYITGYISASLLVHISFTIDITSMWRQKSCKDVLMFLFLVWGCDYSSH